MLEDDCTAVEAKEEGEPNMPHKINKSLHHSIINSMTTISFLSGGESNNGLPFP
jgi:hypothetical protein